jgi:Asp/Glu/hydantoin racemase
MRTVMIHATAGSVPPVRLAFQGEFPEAELINVLDESLFIDFDQHITPRLRRRMSQLICYCAENGADAIGLACSVYAPMVESARELVEIPLLSSYDAVMDEAVSYGSRIGIIASQPATLRDSEHYLRRAAQQRGVDLQPRLCLAKDLPPVLRQQGEEAFQRRLAEEVNRLAPEVDAVLPVQFYMASALDYLRQVTDVPVLSAPHSSALRLKELLAVTGEGGVRPVNAA